jgi:hypothetical protein
MSDGSGKYKEKYSKDVGKRYPTPPTPEKNYPAPRCSMLLTGA